MGTVNKCVGLITLLILYFPNLSVQAADGKDLHLVPSDTISFQFVQSAPKWFEYLLPTSLKENERVIRLDGSGGNIILNTIVLSLRSDKTGRCFQYRQVDKDYQPTAYKSDPIAMNLRTGDPSKETKLPTVISSGMPPLLMDFNIYPDILPPDHYAATLYAATDIPEKSLIPLSFGFDIRVSPLWP